nr:unnamed protein product [Digitaria exilis]
MGSTRGMMSGFVRASRLSRAFSGRSPVKRRYLVPLRPCARRARSSRHGTHHAHSSVQAASHTSATAAAKPARVHGGVSRSSSRARVAIGYLAFLAHCTTKEDGPTDCDSAMRTFFMTEQRDG